ncbi:unnamed protein product [Plutella xylostella]|uniref:(diamondback moth) hypothetical protein n=1 Tax=Plutella xylostella TaxID=51655 RepID=A0A8S4F7Q8_PLUXY|nr:unnamed protein product [Plutella xylostella]
MSDSDSDCVSEMFTSQKGNGVFRLKGPNFDSNLTVRSNTSVVPSNLERTHQGNYSVMLTNFESMRPGFRGALSHRGAFSHRETSPTMSLRSLDLPPRNFQQSFCRSGFAQSSVIGGRDRTRAVSPTASMISIGSNVSVAASEYIVSALKSMQFNKHEMKNIKDAYNKYVKGRIRKKLTKRRYLKQCMKYARQLSSDDSDDAYTKKRRRQSVDSGELGSDSSCSSNDVTSVRTGVTKKSSYSKHKSFKRPTQPGNNSDDSKSVRSEMQEFRKTIQGSTMVKDSTNSLKHDSFRNIFSLGPRSNCNQSNATLTAEVNKPTTLKERFQSSFLLPSQRFSKSISVQPIAEEQPKNSVKNRKLVFRHNGTNNYKTSTRPMNLKNKNNENNNETDSDEENIFSEITDPEKSILKHPQIHNKRNLNSSDESETVYSQNKKTKLSPPRKESQKENQKEVVQNNTNQKNHDSDFVFAKPCGLPVRKSVNTKKTEVQLAYNVSADPKNKVPTATAQAASVNVATEHTEVDEQSETIQSDVSSRPSFMKRKLFTQTLDVTENKGQDTSPGISPQKVYDDVMKEKNKTRKLVTNQSCLTRNVNNEDNNLLDLIQKIVPLQNMSVTSNTTQKRDSNLNGDSNVNNNNNKVPEDKWDITAIISTCNNEDMSDTYTDEEIFTVHSKEKPGQIKKGRSPKALKKCLVVVEPIPNVKTSNPNGVKPNTRILQKEKSTPKKNETMPKSLVRQAHAFWNCDSESEGPNTPTIVQPFTRKLQAKEVPISQKLAENASEKSVMVKNIKSVLEMTESSNESSMSIECVGNTVEKVASNRSLRLKTIKALRDKKTTSAKPCKPKDLQESLSNLLGKGDNNKKSQQKLTSFFDSETASKKKPAEKKCSNNAAGDKQDRKPNKDKQDNSIVAPKSQRSAQPELNRSTRARARTVTSVKNMLTNKSVDKIGNKAELNVSKRGRPRKNLNSTTPVSKENEDAAANIDADKNKVKTDGKPKPTSNRVSDLNKSQRERLRKLSTPFKINQVKAPAKTDLKIKAPAKADLNVSKRGRPRKALNNGATPSKTSKVPVTNKNDQQTSSKQIDEFISPIAFRTRRSKENSILKSPVRNLPPKPARNAKKSLNTTVNTSRRKNISNESNKENTSKGVYRKSPRNRKNNSLLNCCESPIKKTAEAEQKNDVKFVQPAVPSRVLHEVPDSPEASMSSFRPVRQTRKGRAVEGAGGSHVGLPGAGGARWAAGVARATVGAAPRHCAADQTLGSAVDDDARSFRSASSRSLLARSGRIKFLHVF